MPEFSYRDPEYYEKTQTKKTIEFWLQPIVKNNLVRFDFTSNNQWSAEYRSPLDNAGISSEWRFLCSGKYTSSSEAIIHKIVLMLADKLRSVSQDYNDISLNSKYIIRPQQPTNPLNQSNTSKNMNSSIVSTVKRLTLKLTDPDESILRESGIHNDCGELTQDGKTLLVDLLHSDYKAKLVELGKQIITENNKK